MLPVWGQEGSSRPEHAADLRKHEQMKLIRWCGT